MIQKKNKSKIMKAKVKNAVKKFIPKSVIIFYRYNIKEITLNKKIRRFYSLLINKGDLCFDIGANVGNRILPLLQIGAKVIAIEPQQQCVEILKKRFNNKIEIIQKGVGSKNEIRDFYISENSVLSSFSDDFINKTKNERFSNNSWDNSEKVEILKLDDIIIQFGKPHFVKIDVEGLEYEVLQGLNTPIKLMSFEFIFPEFKENAVQCIKRIDVISDKYVFNISEGETMKFETDKWLSCEKMLEKIESIWDYKCWGDIYAKLVYD